MKPQCERLLEAMKKGAEVTPNYALVTMGVGRLAARIRDLRDMGEDIVSRYVRVTNRYGEKVRVKAYRLAKSAA